MMTFDQFENPRSQLMNVCVWVCTIDAIQSTHRSTPRFFCVFVSDFVDFEFVLKILHSISTDGSTCIVGKTQEKQSIVDQLGWERCTMCHRIYTQLSNCQWELRRTHWSTYLRIANYAQNINTNEHTHIHTWTSHNTHRQTHTETRSTAYGKLLFAIWLVGASATRSYRRVRCERLCSTEFSLHFVDFHFGFSNLSAPANKYQKIDLHCREWNASMALNNGELQW